MLICDNLRIYDTDIQAVLVFPCYPRQLHSVCVSSTTQTNRCKYGNIMGVIVLWIDYFLISRPQTQASELFFN